MPGREHDGHKQLDDEERPGVDEQREEDARDAVQHRSLVILDLVHAVEASQKIHEGRQRGVDQ